MKNSIRLNLPLWVIVVAGVLVAVVVGWAVLSLSHTTYGTRVQTALRAQLQQQMQTMNGTLDKALGQLNVALQRVDLASQAANLAGLQTYVHQVLNIIEGKQGPDYNVAAGDPGDGHGVQVYLQDLMKMPINSSTIAMSVMKSLGLPSGDQIVQTLQSAGQTGQEVAGYLNQALKAPLPSAAQGPLQEAANALKEIQGTPGSMDPKTGGLAFVKGVVAQMMRTLP
jgi:hypothetical protein